MVGRRFRWAAIGAAVVVIAGLGTGQEVPLALASTSTGDRAIYEPVTPARILDTRSAGQGPALGAGATKVVQVTGSGGVPADATAVVLNVTAVAPTASGFLTLFPTGEAQPTVSNVNFVAGQTVPNAATVKLGQDATAGQLSIFNFSGTTGVILDVAGYYRAHTFDDRYLLKEEAQGRSAAGAFSCAAGRYLQAVAPDGTPTCVVDAGTTYSAGTGISFAGTTINAAQARSDANAFTCPAGQFLRVVSATGAPTCGADQTGTTYTAGTGISIAGTTINAAQARSDANAFTCPAGQALQAVSATGAPTCISVGLGASGFSSSSSNAIPSTFDAYFPVTGQFTASRDLTCMVSSSIQVTAASGLSNGSVFYRNMSEINGTNANDIAYGQYPYVTGTTSYQPPAARSSIFSINAGQAVRFGVYLGNASSWSGSNLAAEVSYTCS